MFSKLLERLQAAPHLRKWWAQAALVFVISLIAVGFISSLFGITGEICEQGQHANNGECSRHNLLLVLLSEIVGIANWLSPVITALATIAIGWFTLSLRNSTDKLAEISTNQTKLLAEQHLVEHRPLLRIRHVALNTLTPADDPTIAFNHGREVSGGLGIVNVGGTPAAIISSRYRIFFSADGLPTTSPLDNSGNELIVLPETLNVGMSVAVSIVDIADMGTAAARRDPTEMILREFSSGGFTVYVMGQIEYADEGGNHRFMGFCREWKGKGPFRAVDNPDYEYQD